VVGASIRFFHCHAPTAQNIRECGANGELVAFRSRENPPPKECGHHPIIRKLLMENSSTGVVSFAQAAFSERTPKIDHKKLPELANHILKPV